MISILESPVERDTKIAVASANISQAVPLAGASQCQFNSDDGTNLIEVRTLPDQVLDDVRALSSGHLKQMRYRRFSYEDARRIVNERETEFKMDNDVDGLFRRTMARGMGEYS